MWLKWYSCTPHCTNLVCLYDDAKLVMSRAPTHGCAEWCAKQCANSGCGCLAMSVSATTVAVAVAVVVVVTWGSAVVIDVACYVALACHEASAVVVAVAVCVSGFLFSVQSQPHGFVATPGLLW